MIKEKLAKVIIQTAKLTARYADGKASVWTHHQPKAPKTKGNWQCRRYK